MDPVPMDMRVPHFYEFTQQNGGSVDGRHQPLIEYGNGPPHYRFLDADPQDTQVSYLLGSYSPIDDDVSDYSALASQPIQQGETPRYIPIFNDERDVSRVPYHNENYFGEPAMAPQDAAVQGNFAHGYARDTPSWNRLSSVHTPRQIPMDIDPVTSTGPTAHRGRFGLGQGVTQTIPEFDAAQQVFSYHPSQDRHHLPHRIIPREHDLRSSPLHNPVKPLRSEPMRRGSKVMPIYVHYEPYGSLDTQPKDGNPRYITQVKDFLAPISDPDFGLQPKESPNNHWFRPASSIDGDVFPKRSPTEDRVETRKPPVQNTLGANRGVGFPPLNRPVASGTRTGPRKPVNPFPLQKPYKPVSGPKFPIKMVRVQPRGSGSVASDQKGSGGNHHVFDKKDMEEVAPSRTRNLSPSGKEHAARVRAKGACEPCRKAKRKCIHVLEEDQASTPANRQSENDASDDRSALSTSPEGTAIQTPEAAWTPGSPLTPASETAD